ncbi:uncharacterized protein F4807DRAFT_404055 [Annulohypoxylon truncatum]|uniref:uncharacterized protein n=1 Tax=Annulohypoxylon truncatum TaxID=327061 RepID=UPI002008B4E8|nr:uncharacterized protein F4807DRAFT_404055 [Annulohypoxylon truncatum]KAI1214638.1 hypothetical protein F4807DRAFT_404055 [Annulohypoxylon truncatum]
MGDPLGAAGSIIGIAAFGLKCVTTLQTYVEAVVDARKSLRDIAFDVSVTASALNQLHQFIELDKNGKAVANDSGVQEVARLASKCKQVYTAVMKLISKAVGAPRDDNGEISIDALDSIDLNESNVKRLVQRLKWPFKQHRIKKHQEELRWLKISLLFHLRLMELAKTKIMAPTRSLSAREKEMALQATLEKLSASKHLYAKRIASGRRRYKGKVRAKRGFAKTRPSSLSRETIDKGKRLLSTSPLNNNTRELSPSSISGDDNFRTQNILPSKELLTEPVPDTPWTTEDNKEPGNNIGPLSPSSPIPKSQCVADRTPEPIRTQDNTHIPTTITANNQLGAQHSSPATANEDKEKEYLNNHGNQDVEAYIVEVDNPDLKSNSIRKLPFDRQEISDEFKRIMESQRGDVVTRYMSLTSIQRENIQRVLLEAEKTGSHEKICKAINFTQSEDSCMIVFLSPRAPAQPVHLNYKSRSFHFAFELCRTWEDMVSLIKPILTDIRNPDTFLRAGQYELKDPNDRIILPSTWSSTVQPGLTIFLVPHPAVSQYSSSLQNDDEPNESNQSNESCESDESSTFTDDYLGCTIRWRRPSQLWKRSWLRRATYGVLSIIPFMRRDSRGQPSMFEGERVHEQLEIRAVSCAPGPGEVDPDEEDEENDSDIIDFEEEAETGRFVLGEALEKWTNARDAPLDGE